MKKITNIAGSNRAKLLALARERGENFQFLLGRWIVERFLYRLSLSAHKDSFCPEGGDAVSFVGGTNAPTYARPRPPWIWIPGNSGRHAADS